MVPVDAVLISDLVAKYNITTNPALTGYTVIENLASDHIGIAFAKGAYKLCGAVEEALYALAQEGTVASITTEWFGSDISLIAKADAAVASSLEAVTTAGVLKVGIDAAFAPLTFKDADGNYTGYDIELATAVAAKLGVAVEFVEVDWANLEAALADGTIDCVWSGMSITDDRKASMTVSDAYLESNTVLLVHKEVAGFIDDLAGKTVAVQAGSYSETILANDFAHLFTAENIVKVADSDAGIAAVIAQAEIDAAAKADKDAGKPVDETAGEGKVLAQAVMLDSTYADYAIATNEALADFITIEELYADVFGIGFAKGDYLLCGAVEEALYALTQDGTVASISATWFGK
jgi:polar amino acid transport system substrate-binding protein